MNFLAHLYLSGDDPNVQVGNFIGDFVKGRSLIEQFGPDIARGIELHRAIDEFTDRHPVVAKSKNRLRPTYRHYAGVIVDIFYDHFLAHRWDEYHDEFLPDYAERMYSLMDQHQAILPEEVKYMMPYMTRGNWLVNYARLEGIHRALTGMARRSRHGAQMEFAIKDLKTDYELYAQEFATFFPELHQYARNWLSLADQ